jgi:molybdate/tungstate transport system substrate-binding protein
LKNPRDKRRFLMKGILPKIASTVLVVLALTFLVAVLVTVPGCTTQSGNQNETLAIFHAGSLAGPFTDLADEFEGLNPNVDVVLTSGGSAAIISQAIAQVDAGESPPDIIASADYKLIPSKMYGGDYADWYIAFAKNTMVLCYRDNAPGSDKIVSGNRTWYDVLRNDAVSYGHSDPDQDPCGYRTLMVTQLAQAYYCDNATDFGLTPDDDADGLYDALIPGGDYDRGRTGGTNSTARPGGSEEIVSAKSVDLITALEAGDLDYAFEYLSVAMQHDLNYITLDDHINLSRIDAELEGVEEFYATAYVWIIKTPGPPPTYSKQTGSAIVYGVTIPVHAENEEIAAQFIYLLLSHSGKYVMEVENYQPMLDPPICDHPENLPDLLKPLFD